MQHCTKCGREMTEGSSVCPNCGANSNAFQNPVQVNYNATATGSKMDIASILCFVVAGLVLVLCLIACFKMMGGAGALSDLESVAGGTIAEAYYNECGTVYGGFALFIMAFGFFGSGLLAYLGFKNMKK